MCDALGVTDPAPRPERAPLPRDPWSLPDPGPGWAAELDAGCAALGLTLGPGVHAALDAHTRLLLAWNAAINLTALRTPEQVARLHLVDSLSAVRLIDRLAQPEPSIADIGSGGGMPGLPLAVALPAGRLLAVDSVGKKVGFLAVATEAAAAALADAGGAVPLLEPVAARAEALAADPGIRETLDVVTARAVGSLAELVELAMPLLAPGGILVCWKRDDGSGALAAEIADAGPIAQATGAGRATVHADPEPALPGHRLVVHRKMRPTPARYPRDPAQRRHRAGR